MWIVASMETHGTVQFNQRHTIPLQVEDLRKTAGRTAEDQENEGQEDSRTPVPTPGKHDIGMVAQGQSRRNYGVSRRDAHSLDIGLWDKIEDLRIDRFGSKSDPFGGWPSP